MLAARGECFVPTVQTERLPPLFSVGLGFLSHLWATNSELPGIKFGAQVLAFLTWLEFSSVKFSYEGLLNVVSSAPSPYTSHYIEHEPTVPAAVPPKGCSSSRFITPRVAFTMPRLLHVFSCVRVHHIIIILYGTSLYAICEYIAGAS